jgi:malate synthase
MPAPNQIASKKRGDVNVIAADLLHFEPETPITEKGLRLNINVAIQYIGAWLAGQGAVPIFNLMEDAATAEISRSQVWQWIRSPKGVLDDGRKVTKAMVAAMIPEEMQKIRELLGPAYGEGKYDNGDYLYRSVNKDTFVGSDAAGIRAVSIGFTSDLWKQRAHRASAWPGYDPIHLSLR